MNVRSHGYRCAIRGAWIGALTGGISGFLVGLAVCIHFKIPIPPIGTAEIGAFLGALLGALGGWIASNSEGRRILAGTLAGTAIGGLLMALQGVHWTSLLGAALLGAFLGHQARGTRTGDGWQRLSS
ncbi:MAG: hypothetical protein HY319_03145 [Armatimonadetes bacterium]|nr:hypothetical protein [Armatimonadota bacterium]